MRSHVAIALAIILTMIAAGAVALFVHDNSADPLSAYRTADGKVTIPGGHMTQELQNLLFPPPPPKSYFTFSPKPDGRPTLAILGTEHRYADESAPTARPDPAAPARPFARIAAILWGQLRPMVVDAFNFFTGSASAADGVCGVGTDNCYWVGGTGNFSDTTLHWASTSNGVPGLAPIATSPVIFDANAGAGTATQNVSPFTSGAVTMTNSSVTISGSTNTWKVGGGFLDANTHFARATSTVEFTASGTVTVAFNTAARFYGLTIDSGITTTITNHTYLDGPFTVNGTITAGSNLTMATLYANANPMTMGASGAFSSTVFMYFGNQTSFNLPGSANYGRGVGIAMGGAFVATATGDITTPIVEIAYSANWSGGGASTLDMNNHNLTVTNTLNDVSGREAHLLTGTGAVTTSIFSFVTAASYVTSGGSGSWSVSGAWTNASTSTSWSFAAPITFNATTAKTVTFCGNNGTTQCGGSSNAEFQGAVTFDQGSAGTGFSYTMATNNVRIGGLLTITRTAGSGTVTLTTSGSNLNITAGGVTIAANGALTANASAISVSGNWDSSAAGTFTKGTSTVTMTGSGKTLSFLNSSNNFNNLTINGTVSTAGSNVDATSTMLTGTLTGTGTFTVTGNWDSSVGFTFTKSTSTIVMSGTSKTVKIGAGTFYNLTVAGSVTMNSAITVDNAATINSAKSLTLNSNNLVVGASGVSGVLTVTGNLVGAATATGWTVTLGNSDTFTVTAVTTWTADTQYKWSHTATGAIAITISITAGANGTPFNVLKNGSAFTSGTSSSLKYTFTMNTADPNMELDPVVSCSPTCYWIGGTGNFSSTAHWSGSSGGTSCSCTPQATDSVIFDASSGAGTATQDNATFTSGPVTMTNSSVTVADGDNTWKVGGNWSDNGHFAFTNCTSAGFNGLVEFTATGSITYAASTGGTTFCNVTIDSGVTSTFTVDGVGFGAVLTVTGHMRFSATDIRVFIRNDKNTANPLVVSGDINGFGAAMDTIYLFTQNGALIHIPASTYTNMNLRMFPQNLVAGDGVEYRADGAVSAGRLEFFCASGRPYFFNSQTFNMTLTNTTSINYLTVATCNFGIKATSGTWALTGGLDWSASGSASGYIQFGSTAWTVATTWNNTSTSASWNKGTGTVTFTNSLNFVTDIFGDATNYVGGVEFNNVTFNSNAATTGVSKIAGFTLKLGGLLSITDSNAGGTTELNDATNNKGIVAGAVTIGIRGILRMGTATVTVNGNWSTVNSSSFDMGTSTVVFAANGTATVGDSDAILDGTYDFYNLTVNAGVTTTLGRNPANVDIYHVFTINGKWYAPSGVTQITAIAGVATQDPIVVSGSTDLTQSGLLALVNANSSGLSASQHAPAATYQYLALEGVGGSEIRLTGNITTVACGTYVDCAVLVRTYFDANLQSPTSFNVFTDNFALDVGGALWIGDGTNVGGTAWLGSSVVTARHALAPNGLGILHMQTATVTAYPSGGTNVVNDAFYTVGSGSTLYDRGPHTYFETATVTLNGNFHQLDTPVFIDLGASGISISGSWDTSVGTTMGDTVAGTSTVTFTGTSKTIVTQDNLGGNAGSERFYNLTLAVGSSVRLNNVTDIAIGNVFTINGAWTTATEHTFLTVTTSGTASPLVLGVGSTITTVNAGDDIYFFNHTLTGTVVNVPVISSANLNLVFSPYVSKAFPGIQFKVAGAMSFYALDMRPRYSGPLGTPTLYPFYFDSQTFNVSIQYVAVNPSSYTLAQWQAAGVTDQPYGIRATSGTWALASPGPASGMVPGPFSQFYIKFGSTTWNVAGSWTTSTTAADANWDAGTSTVNLTGSGGTTLSNLPPFRTLNIPGLYTVNSASIAFFALHISGGTMTMNSYPVRNADLSTNSGTITLTQWNTYHTQQQTDISWNMNPSAAGAAITMTFGGLQPSSDFTLQRDAIIITTATSDPSGSVTFTLTGGWSLHTMRIVGVAGGGGGGGGPPAANNDSIVATHVSGLTYDFTIQGNNTSTITTVSWDFGDGYTQITTGTAAARHTFAQAGTYNVSATVYRASSPPNSVTTVLNVSGAGGLPSLDSVVAFIFALVALIALIGAIVSKSERTRLALAALSISLSVFVLSPYFAIVGDGGAVLIYPEVGLLLLVAGAFCVIMAILPSKVSRARGAWLILGVTAILLWAFVLPTR